MDIFFNPGLNALVAGGLVVFAILALEEGRWWRMSFDLVLAGSCLWTAYAGGAFA